MNYLSTKQIKDLKFKKVGKNVLISKNASIIDPGKIEIGNNSRIDDFSLLYGSIKIGRNVHITPMCLIGAGKTKIQIDDFCTLAYGVKIFSQSDDYLDGYMTNSTINKKFKKITKKRVLLKKHCIIGTNSVVFPGCKLEEGTAVGAMSLVNHNTQSWSVYVGIPAILKKKRNKISKKILKKFLITKK